MASSQLLLLLRLLRPLSRCHDDSLQDGPVNATQTFYGQRRPPSTTTTAAATVDDGRVATAASASTAWRQVACGAASQEELFGRNRKGHDDGDRRRLATVPTTLAHRQEIVQNLQVNFSHTRTVVLVETPFDNGCDGSFKKKQYLIYKH